MGAVPPTLSGAQQAAARYDAALEERRQDDSDYRAWQRLHQPHFFVGLDGKTRETPLARRKLAKTSRQHGQTYLGAGAQLDAVPLWRRRRMQQEQLHRDAQPQQPQQHREEVAPVAVDLVEAAEAINAAPTDARRAVEQSRRAKAARDAQAHGQRDAGNVDWAGSFSGNLGANSLGARSE